MGKDTAQRLEDAIELADLAERMVRARLRRQHPDESAGDIEARVRLWLQEDRARLGEDETYVTFAWQQ